MGALPYALTTPIYNRPTPMLSSYKIMHALIHTIKPPSDLNPIEQVWGCFKELLQKHHPYTAHMPGGSETIRAKLTEVLPQMWGLIEEDLITSDLSYHTNKSVWAREQIPPCNYSRHYR